MSTDSLNSATDRTPDPEGPEGPEGNNAADPPAVSSPKSPVRESIVKMGSKTHDTLGKATKSTTKHLVQTTKTITHATEKTTKQIGSAIKHSEEVYENSPWCSGVRWIPKHFPRFVSFTFGVLIPLWILILISAGFGIILADYEAPAELES